MALRKWVGLGVVVLTLGSVWACSSSSGGGAVANGGGSANNSNGNGNGGSGNGSGSGNGNGNNAGATHTTSFEIASGAAVAADEFPARLAEAYCAWVESCCEFAGLTPNTGACVADWSSEIQEVHDSLTSAGAAFDADNAGDCIATFATIPCNDPEIWEGLLQEAAEARFGDDEALIDLDDDEVCGAYSRGTRAAGESCTWDLECAAPEGIHGHCDTSTLTCVQTPFAGEGEPCGTESDCLAPFSCLPSQTCGPQQAEGEPCSADEHCEMGLICVVDTCAAVPSAEDGPCNEPEDCDEGLACLLSNQVNHCVLPGDEGAPCVAHEECEAELYCTPFGAGTCNPRKEPGAPCESREECLSGDCGGNSGDVRECLPYWTLDWQDLCALQDATTTDAGMMDPVVMPTPGTPPQEGCYVPYTSGAVDGLCDPMVDPLYCDVYSIVTAVCTDGRVFEHTCSDSCECSCGLQGEQPSSTCTAEPNCSGGSCAPENCDNGNAAGWLDCCNDADCFDGMPYCRNNYCARDTNAGTPSTACPPPVVDPCANVSCAEGHTCVEGSCWCGKNPACGRSGNCVNDACSCGGGAPCPDGQSCLDDACQ